MTGISLGQAVRNAIEAELAASSFYALLADSTEDRETRSFLEEMSRQEIAHARSIEHASKELLDDLLPTKATGDVDGVETLPDWRFVDDITLTQAFEVALAAEQQASMFYDAISDCFEGGAQAFFRSLSQAEEKHARSIRERLERP